MKDLETFIKDNKKFVKLLSGQTFEGFYRGYVVGKDPFDKNIENPKDTVVYRLQEDGSEKILTWNCKQSRVAEDMSKIAVNSKIRITRSGSGANDTRYTIVELK